MHQLLSKYYYTSLSNLVQLYSLMENLMHMNHETFIYAGGWGGSTSLFYVHSFAEGVLHCA